MSVVAWVTAVVLVVLALAVALAATRAPSWEPPVRRAVLVAEAWLVVVAVVDVGLVLRAEPGDRPESMVTHLGYAVAAAGLVPLVARRPAGEGDGEEPAPASLWVLVVALLAAAVCVVRLVQTR